MAASVGGPAMPTASASLTAAAATLRMIVPKVVDVPVAVMGARVLDVEADGLQQRIADILNNVLLHETTTQASSVHVELSSSLEKLKINDTERIWLCQYLASHLQTLLFKPREEAISKTAVHARVEETDCRDRGTVGCAREVRRGREVTRVDVS